MPTASAIIIGDEILSGKFPDENSPWLVQRCKELGIDLIQIAVIRDQVDEIANTIRRCSSISDYVFTTGGVGPTHDDVTMVGVAEAFETQLHRHPDIEAILKEKMGEQCTEEALTMADIPINAQLWWDGSLFFPQVVLENVLIFPGVPKLLKMKFNAVAHRLKSTPKTVVELVTTASESEIAKDLALVQQQWPEISIGSYPRYDKKPWTVIISLSGRNTSSIKAAAASLRQKIKILDVN